MDDYYYFYCPICGNEVFDDTKICPNCKNFIHAYRSIYNTEYYKNKSIEKYGDYKHSLQILIDEEVSKCVQYNPDTTEHNAVNEYNEMVNNIFKNNEPNKNIPKCPTCGSTNIKSISFTKRAAHATLFGLFSKTAKSQFECKDCGYKW